MTVTFKEQFCEAYRTTRRAVKANDKENTLAGLTRIYHLFENQIRKKNGDDIYIKATLSQWQEVFGTYLQIVKTQGLSDRRVQKFFGMPRDNTLTSPEDPREGEQKAADESAATIAETEPNGGVDISGIFSPVEEAAEERNADLELPNSQLPIGHALAEEYWDAGELPQEELQPENPENDVPKEKSIAMPSYEPGTLASFIGQQHIVKVLRKEIAIARAEGRKHLDNILLLGNPGLGKTTLMELIAKELDVRYEWMDCSQYRNSQQSLKALQNFLINVAQADEPVVIAFDEIHRLTDELQSSLLTLLQSRVYVSPPDINGNVKRIPIREFTFIAATTDDDKVLGTIKDRCLRLKFQMADYTPEELKRIYRNKVFAKGLTITEEAIETCIPRSRGSIRYVNSFVEGLDRALYNDEGIRLSTHIDLQTALCFFEERGIDPIGLESKDLEILQAIGRDGDGMVSADTISARVGLDSRKYLSEYEPYLKRIGFIAITGKGRGLTEKAIRYLEEQQSKETETK